MIKFNYKKIFATLISAFILVVPFIIFADSSPYTIKNPLGDGNTTVQPILNKIMNLVSGVGAMVVVFFVIFSGFKFVTAGGNEGEVTKAKDMFYATIIGGAILLGASIIASVVVNTVQSTLK